MTWRTYVPEAEVVVAAVGPDAAELVADGGGGERVPLGPHELGEAERQGRPAVAGGRDLPAEAALRAGLVGSREREEARHLLLGARRHAPRHAVADEQERAPLLGGARRRPRRVVVGAAHAAHVHHRDRVAASGLH